jgi:hypothetical protein
VTPWQISGILFGLAVYAVAWIWGGRPERLGAGLLFLAYLLSTLTDTWGVATVEDSVRLLIFGWMCLRFDRWWLLLTTAALSQVVFVDVFKLLNPTFPRYTAISAQVGLEFLVDLGLLVGVFERWLAGAAGQTSRVGHGGPGHGNPPQPNG